MKLKKCNELKKSRKRRKKKEKGKEEKIRSHENKRINGKTT